MKPDAACGAGMRRRNLLWRVTVGRARASISGVNQHLSLPEQYCIDRSRCMGGLSGRREVRMDAQKRVPPIADTPHSDVLYTGTVQIHRSTPLPHRSEVKSPQFPKPSDPRFQMRFLCVRNFIPNENRKLKQYTVYNFRHNTHQLHSLFNPT